MKSQTGVPRLIMLALAAACIGVIWLRGGGEPVRLSGWGPLGAAAPASVAGQASAGSLSGVAQQRGRGLPGELRPQGSPLQAANAVMTQGYGVGTHAPAEIWGAVDLALDGDGDGVADPDGSWDAPVYATHSGVVEVTPNSHPAGNHIWVGNDEYRTGYSHLSGFTVRSGQSVRKGDVIGFMGSTGMSSGPHLDYQVWEQREGAWVNVNPLDYGALGP